MKATYARDKEYDDYANYQEKLLSKKFPAAKAKALENKKGKSVKGKGK